MSRYRYVSGRTSENRFANYVCDINKYAMWQYTAACAYRLCQSTLLPCQLASGCNDKLTSCCNENALFYVYYSKARS